MKIIYVQGSPFELTDEKVELLDDNMLNLVVFNTIFTTQKKKRTGSCGQYTGRHWNLLTIRLNDLGIDVDCQFNNHGVVYVKLYGGINKSQAMDLTFQRALCKAAIYYWMSYGLEIEDPFLMFGEEE